MISVHSWMPSPAIVLSPTRGSTGTKCGWSGTSCGCSAHAPRQIGARAPLARGIRGMLKPPRGIETRRGRGTRPPRGPWPPALASGTHRSPIAIAASNASVPRTPLNRLFMGKALTRCITQRLRKKIREPAPQASALWRMPERRPKRSPDTAFYPGPARKYRGFRRGIIE